MAKDPLLSFQQTWSKRASAAESRGYSSADISPVYQMDLARIQKGSAPYTEAEAGDAIAAAAGVQPIQQTGGTKADYNPLTLLGRAAGDIGTTLKELPKMPAAIVKDLTHIGKMPGALAHGAGEIASGQVGQGLQDISHAPGLQSALLVADAIPGVDLATAPLTAAVMGAGVLGQALTPQGRVALTKHPGQALLNLLPAAGETGLIGGVEDAAKLSDAQAARAGGLGLGIDDTGNPILQRQGLTPEQLAEKQTVRVPGSIRARLEQIPMVQRAEYQVAGRGFGKLLRQKLYGPTSDINQTLVNTMDDFATQHGVQAWFELPTEVQQNVTHWAGLQRKAGESIPVDIVPPEYRHLLPQIQNELIPEISAQTERLLSDSEISAVALPDSMGGGVEYYKAGSAVPRLSKSLDRAKTRLSKATQRHRDSVDALNAAQDAHQATLVNGEAPNIGKIVQSSQQTLHSLKTPEFDKMMSPAQRADIARRGGAIPHDARIVSDGKALTDAKAAYGRLTGAAGPIQRAIRYLSEGKHTQVVSRLTSPEVKGLIARVAKVDPESAAALQGQIDGLAQNLHDNIRPGGLLERNKAASEALGKAQDVTKRAAATAKSSSDAVSRTMQDFHTSLARDPSARFMPKINEAFWQRMTQIADDLYSKDPARHQQAMQAIAAKDMDATFGDLGPESPRPFSPADETRDPNLTRPRKTGAAPEATGAPATGGDISRMATQARASGKAEQAAYENKIFPDAQQTFNDVAKTWTELRKDGFDPIFLHKMSPLAKGKLPAIRPGSSLVPTITKARGMDVSGGYLDLGFGLLRSEAELQASRMADELVNNHIVPYLTLDKKQAVQSLLDRERAAGNDKITKAEIEARLNQTHVAFNAAPLGSKHISGTTDRIIPKEIQHQIDVMGQTKGDTGILRQVRNAQGVYVFAVTGLSPLHVSHVAFSNIFALGVTDPIGALRSIRTARALTKGEDVAGIGTLPVSFHQPSQFPSELNDLYGAGNKTKVRLMLESRLPAGLSAADKALWIPRKLQELQTRADTWMSQLGRATEYVVARKQGFDPEEALYETGRVMSLWREMNTTERNVLRTVMPFYGWTKYLMRFALQYPIDHPIRAGIVSNFAETEQQDWGSGLPQNLAQMFFTGKPNALGVTTAFDIRQVNPFRDLGNDFTWAGFAGALNPVIDAGLRTMGVNTYSGSAELYPQLSVDPNTGSLVAKRGDFLGNLATSVLPQATGVQAILGWSDYMRQLKKTNPSAFRAEVARSFHWPWMPQKISLPQERAREQLNVRTVAQSAASKAMETGNFGTVNQFSEVPYKGQLLTPAQLKALYQMAKQARPNLNPHFALRNVKLK